MMDIGQAVPTYTVSGRMTGYMIELSHTGLHEHRLLKASDIDILQNKVNAVARAWEEKWARVSERRAKEYSREAGKQSAEEQTHAAQRAITDARNILVATLRVNDTVDWASLLDRRQFGFTETSRFPDVQFAKGGKPIRAMKAERRRPKPCLSDSKYQPELSIWDRIYSPSRRRKEDACRMGFDRDLSSWNEEAHRHDESDRAAELQFLAAQTAYQEGERSFLGAQKAANEKVRGLEQRYLNKDPVAITDYCELVLTSSSYPDFISKEFSINYDAGLLAVEYQLPDKSAIPSLDKVTFVASRQEFKQGHLRDSEIDKLYDSVLYQLALRTIHELFEADGCNALRSIVFNGWLSTIDPATGRPTMACLLSLQASKDEFLAIQLDKVEAKACFKQLKGVSAAKLSTITPIRPILQLEKDDPRFVSAYAVADNIDASTNLAAMDWEDFEHLIRELFEKEFSQGDSEVRITRASSDGGVDAVVFDPDPIRGGKIVIQAKRYTATVGVSAVRDLYGTVMNEGANKGILVTTADFGADAFDFVKGKPLTLLNGSNLLHMLEKNGHRARIDVREARLLMGKPA